MQQINHPLDKLYSSLRSTQKDLLEVYEQYSNKEKKFLEDGLLPDSPLFTSITIHSDSDWIPSRPEVPQDFQSFYSNPHRNIPNSTHKTIYSQIIGLCLFLNLSLVACRVNVAGIFVIFLYCPGFCGLQDPLAKLQRSRNNMLSGLGNIVRHFITVWWSNCYIQWLLHPQSVPFELTALHTTFSFMLVSVYFIVSCNFN